MNPEQTDLLCLLALLGIKSAGTVLSGDYQGDVVTEGLITTFARDTSVAGSLTVNGSLVGRKTYSLHVQGNVWITGHISWDPRFFPPLKP
jgi:hypothetical protein